MMPFRPLVSAPVLQCRVTHVHRDDVQHPSVHRPVRTLVEDRRTAERLLPIRGDEFRLYGDPVDDTAAADEAAWVGLDTPMPWKPDGVPVVVSACPLVLTFISRDELDRRRHGAAEQALLQALDRNEEIEPSTRIGRAEHADLLLGGNAIAVATVAALHRRHPDQPADPCLGSRLLAAAPAGLADWRRALAEMPTLRARPDVHDELVAAYSRTLDEADRLRADAWEALAGRTQIRWWLALRAQRTGGIRQAAASLGVPARVMRRWLSGDGPIESESLPDAGVIEADLTAALLDSEASSVATQVSAVQAERCDLFSHQLASLERLAAGTSRLSRWEDLRPWLAKLGDGMRRLEGQPMWEVAEFAAREFRQHLLGEAQAAVGLRPLFDGLSVSLAGATLCHQHQAGAWAAPAGAAPVIFVGSGPLRTARGLARLRFAIAHQIGHVVEAHCLGGPASPCVLLDDRGRGGEREQFANAFAAYVLAPRRSVKRLAGERRDDDAWRMDALFDVAHVFGLSARAAGFHLLNCTRTKDAEGIIRELEKRRDWGERAAALAEQVEVDRADDRALIEACVGEAPRLSVEDALRRPRSKYFEALIGKAAARHLLAASEAEALHAA